MQRVETVINPLMLYVHDPHGFQVNPDFDTEPTVGASPDIQRGITEKLQVKFDAGLPPEKTFDLSAPDQVEGLTWDRREALRVSSALALELGTPALYSLAQTAAFREPTDIHKGFKSSLLGLDLHVRVEEGLTVAAEEISTGLTQRFASEIIDTGREKLIRLPGMNKDVQIAGYEFNPGEGKKRVFIRDVPGCEMFMAATVPDQLQVAERIIRILPYYMEDREIVAQRANELLYGNSKGGAVYSLILGPSGDVKRIRTWFGNKPEQAIVDMVRPLRVDARSSAAAASINNMTAIRCAKEYRALPNEQRQAFPSPSTVIARNIPFEQQMEVLLKSPYTFFPISVLSRQDTGEAVKKLDEIKTYFSIDGRQGFRGGSKLSVPEGVVTLYEGDNTNNCIVIERIPVQVIKNADHGMWVIYASCVFSRVKKADTARVVELGKKITASMSVGLADLKEYMSNNEPFYMTFFGEKLKAKD